MNKKEQEIDVIEICKQLIQHQSTENHKELHTCAEFLEKFLLQNNFDVQKITLDKTDLSSSCAVSDETIATAFNTTDNSNNLVPNLYITNNKNNTKQSAKNKTLLFIGHFDVVPTSGNWDTPAFTPTIQDGYIIGRGICDMKGGIASFISASIKYLKINPSADIQMILNADEEVGSCNSIKKMINHIENITKQKNTCILLGEPSSKQKIGDRIYIGHRGGAIINIKTNGQTGHVAYENNFNALTLMCEFITELNNFTFQHNNKQFPKTKIETTMIHAPNYAENVIPDYTQARANIRYGDDYTLESIKNIFYEIEQKLIKKIQIKYKNNEFIQSNNHDNNIKLFEFTFQLNGTPYACNDEKYIQLLTNAIKKNTNITPAISCEGGLSDARFVFQLCPVLEFGLNDSTIHQENEKSLVSDLYTLENIYFDLLVEYFK